MPKKKKNPSELSLISFKSAEGGTPGVVQRFLCSLSQFNVNLQNTLTKSILIFLSETFQVTIFTQKSALVATQTEQFNISPEGSISF